MANLASTAVTINRAWTEAGLAGKDISCRDVTCVLTGQGGNTNLIGASALQLTQILNCTNAIKSDNSVMYAARPNFAGTAVLLVDLTQATDASRIPADITATVRFIVKGFV
jgi:hypothetical protein